MKTSTSVAFLQLVETLVRAVVGLLLGFTGFIAVLVALYQLAYINFSLLSGSGVVLLVGLAVGGLLLWFSGKLLSGLLKRG